MNDAIFVGGAHSRSYHLHIFKCFLRCKASLFRHRGLKRHTLNKFHYYVRNFFLNESEVQDRYDVGVTSCGCGHACLVEPLPERGVVTNEIEFYYLDCASCFQKLVGSLIKNSHPAFAEPVFKNILPFEEKVAGQ